MKAEEIYKRWQALQLLSEAIYQAYKNVLPKKKEDVRGKKEDVGEEGGEQ